MQSEKCTNCFKEHPGYGKEQWWILNNYFKLFGYFCQGCYDLVKHDGFGNAMNIRAYKSILVKQQIQKANTK